WIEDSSIAMTYTMLAAEEQNLGCCWVQIHLRTDAQGLDAEENVREILSLPGKYRVVGFLAIGSIPA
ncbi:MAG: nitroreductase family protein, partial [Oscillospiraceae bacterium]|nr:nitroreductase family protein [Oscillospiraceae bacterium]